MKLNQNFKPYAKINSKCIEYLNIRSEIRKPEENIYVNLHHLGLGMVPNAHTAKEKIDTLTLSKFTNFVPSKEGYYQNSEKMCVLYVCTCIPALKLGSSVSFF